MLATAKGFYNGSTIVLDPSIKFQKGQEVIVTYSTVNQESWNAKNVSDIVDSLAGAIPNTGKTLSEYREERLKKYESND